MALTRVTSGGIAEGINLRFSAGTLTAPSITFTNDTQTGIYKSGTNAFNLISNGSSKLLIDSNGVSSSGDLISQIFKAQNGTSSAPSFSFVNDSNSGIYRDTSDTGIWKLVANSLPIVTIHKTNGFLVESNIPSLLGGTLSVTNDTTFNSNVTLIGSNAVNTEFFKIKNSALTDNFVVDSFNGNTTIAGTLSTTGNTNLSGTLSIANNTSGQPIKFNAISSVDTNVGMTFSSQGNSSERALLQLTAINNAVNQFTIANAATGNDPTISATGTDTDINVTITPKGSGSLIINGTRAIRIPSGATTDRPSNPINGMLRFNTTTSLSEIYNGATLAWEPLSSGVVSAAGTAASPSIALSTDTDTGIYWSAANELAITTGGTQRVRIRDSAMLIPFGTSAQRPANPVNGEMRYNTSINAPEFYNSTAAEWQFPAVMASVSLTGNTLRAIFGYGYTGSIVSMTNLVSSSGVVANDTTGVGTARYGLAAAGYGGDKAIFGYGITNVNVSMTNLVSNTGVVATDTAGVGTARSGLAAAGYGQDKAIFGLGIPNRINLVGNTGIVASDVTSIGRTRSYPAAATYGGDKAVFGYGLLDGSNPHSNIFNYITNTGIMGSDITITNTVSRSYLAAAGYGGDKAIFGYGQDSSGYLNRTTLITNTGTVTGDVTGVGSARPYLAAAGYGGDKAIFGYGYIGGGFSMTNLVSNTGVVAADTTGIGTARGYLAAAGYSI